jgi:hypothetical protein
MTAFANFVPKAVRLPPAISSRSCRNTGEYLTAYFAGVTSTGFANGLMPIFAYTSSGKYTAPSLTTIEIVLMALMSFTGSPGTSRKSANLPRSIAQPHRLGENDVPDAASRDTATLLYLEVFERPRSAFERPDIADPALGGEKSARSEHRGIVSSNARSRVAGCRLACMGLVEGRPQIRDVRRTFTLAAS